MGQVSTAVLGLVLIGCGGPELVCGEGTHREGNRCVADTAADGDADADGDGDPDPDAGGDGDLIDSDSQDVDLVFEDIDEDTFCGALVEAGCLWRQRCLDTTTWDPGWYDCWSYSDQECRQLVRNVYQPLVASGQWRFSAATLDACREAYVSHPCPTSVPEPCQALLTPGRGQGDSCLSTETLGDWHSPHAPAFALFFGPIPPDGCQEGLYCSTEAEGDACGVCEPLPLGGEHCTRGGRCADGHDCMEILCVERAEVGEPCIPNTAPSLCHPGHSCVEDDRGDWRCVANPTRGEACDPEGLYCYTPGAWSFCFEGRCVALGEGDPCQRYERDGVWYERCSSQLVCEDGTCRSPYLVAENQPCDEIHRCGGPGLRCMYDGDAGVCRPKEIVGLGEPCDTYHTCAPGLFCSGSSPRSPSGTCAEAVGLGEVCFGPAPSCNCAQGPCDFWVGYGCDTGLVCPIDPWEEVDPEDEELNTCIEGTCVPQDSVPCESWSDCSAHERCQRGQCIPVPEHPEFFGPVPTCDG